MCFPGESCPVQHLRFFSQSADDRPPNTDGLVTFDQRFMCLWSTQTPEEMIYQGLNARVTVCIYASMFSIFVKTKKTKKAVKQKFRLPLNLQRICWFKPHAEVILLSWANVTRVTITCDPKLSWTRSRPLTADGSNLQPTLLTFWSWRHWSDQILTHIWSTLQSLTVWAAESLQITS